MAGKKGALSEKDTDITARYTPDFLDTLDGRVGLARTLRQRYRQLTNDLGGEANMSYQEKSLAKRAIHLERLEEKKELLMVAGGKCDENQYIAGINALSGLFTKLGLKRRAKPIKPLAVYLAEKEL